MDSDGEILRKLHSADGEILRKLHNAAATCAKASMLLLSVKQNPALNCLNAKSTQSEIAQETELMIINLMKTIIIERMKRFTLVAFVLLMALWSFLLLMAFQFLLN